MSLPVHNCLVLDMGLLGKHQRHDPHDWWYTSSGGGHQLYDGFVPDHSDWDTIEKNVKQWHCPGRI